MRALVKINNVTPYFERNIDEILNTGFFNSLDSNIIKKNEEYILEIGVPGMTKKDLNIHIDKGVLSVSGQKKIENHSSWLRKVSEFNVQSFHRTFLLPKDIQTENISAKCKNGLLKIVMPKKRFSSNIKIIKVEDVNPSADKNIFNRIKRFMKTIKHKLLRNMLK